MNILSLVFAVLLILALFAHLQLDKYQRFKAIKFEYETYIQNSERDVFNQRQENLYKSYKSHHAKSDKDKAGKRPYNKKLNGHLIFNKEAEDAQNEVAKQHRFLFKELMRNLYHDAPFYKELEEKRPHFLDELEGQLLQAAQAWGKLKSIQDVEKLTLPDLELKEAFHYMLIGTKERAAKPVVERTAEKDPDTEFEEEIEDEELLQVEEGYVSLKQFIHFFPSQIQIHVYLAPKEILEAIFTDATTVHQIIQKREEIYHDLNHQTPESATEEFRHFNAKKKADIKDELLEFKVTKTNPNQK